MPIASHGAKNFWAKFSGESPGELDAPESLRGDRNFAVSIRPDSSAEAAGYLLKISAGDHPGTLVCRQMYFPRDWANIWGRELITRHPLVSEPGAIVSS